MIPCRLGNSSPPSEAARCPTSRPTLKMVTVSSCEALLFISRHGITSQHEGLLYVVTVAAFVHAHCKEREKKKTVLFL